ncbi:MAG: hypothetical protein QOK15_1940 [Nocardioidaceae bacterium]|nr:hypothetical protein [Nocardioidaceae bacterium]
MPMSISVSAHRSNEELDPCALTLTRDPTAERALLASALPLLEHLRERHGLVVAVVAEHPEHDGVVPPASAQADRSRSSRCLDALGLAMGLDVGPEGALTGVCAGGLVVGDPVGGARAGLSGRRRGGSGRRKSGRRFAQIGCHHRSAVRWPTPGSPKAQVFAHPAPKTRGARATSSS